jgi:hypothetical protein
MGVLLSYKLLPFTQYLNGYLAELQDTNLYAVRYLNGYLAELENAGLYAVKLLDLMKNGEEVGAVLQPRALSSLNFFPCSKWTVSRLTRRREINSMQTLFIQLGAQN